MGQNYKHFTDGSIQRKLADIHWKAVLCVFLSKTHENVKKNRIKGLIIERMFFIPAYWHWVDKS